MSIINIDCFNSDAYILPNALAMQYKVAHIVACGFHALAHKVNAGIDSKQIAWALTR